MKNFLFLFALVLFFGCKNESTDQHEFEEDKLFPNDWFFAQRAYPSGKINKKAYQEALAFRQNQINTTASKGFAGDWESFGPTNIGGRISDIEMPAGNADIIYAGAASGGIFKSTDFGQNWTPIFDDALSLSIGDIDIAPSDDNVIYVGTGEANAGGGSLAYDGLGIYKSTDAGASWIHLGLENIGSVGKVEVHPTNPDIAYVAAMGDLFGSNPERGVFKTSDGGTTWEHVLSISDSTGVIDLAIHPTDPEIVFAAAWERIRRPNRRKYSGATSGVYKTTDGGTTWEMLDGGLPTQANQKGRIGLAIAPSNPDVIYSLFVHDDGDLTGIYRSKNQGNDWAPINTSGIREVPFMWWFGKIAVAPDDENKAYVVGFNMHVNNNVDQNSWQTIFGGAHVDQHAICSHPSNPERVVIGNDGGVYLSENGGSSHVKSNGLPITQFYTCEMDFQFPEQLYGGSQDNNPMRSIFGLPDAWFRFYGGDGFVTLVDPTDNNFIYTESQNGGFARSINGGIDYLGATNGIDGNDRNNWNTPFILDPADPKTLYFGTQRVYKTSNRALFWTPISPDLTDGNGGGNITFGTITTLAASTINNQIILAGTDDGNVSITTDGGTNWKNISDDLPKFWVTRVVTDPFDVSTIYATISGFRYNEEKAHIFKSTDLGENWKSISGNLPNIPINDLVINPTSTEKYIATDVGVYSSFDDGVSWEIFGSELPNVPITDLTFHDPTQTLLAATYGRSMYKIQTDPNVSVKYSKPNFQITLFPNPATGEIFIKSPIEFEEYKIIAPSGKVILSGKTAVGEAINVSNLPAGQFFILVSNDEKIGSGSFVKQ